MAKLDRKTNSGLENAILGIDLGCKIWRYTYENKVGGIVAIRTSYRRIPYVKLSPATIKFAIIQNNRGLAYTYLLGLKPLI